MIKEHPILFSGQMVRAILEGRKTQTRRIIKPQPQLYRFGDRESLAFVSPATIPGYLAVGIENVVETPSYLRCPYGIPGDRLWLKENAWYFGHWVKNGLTESGKQKWKAVINKGTDIIYQANGGKPNPVLKKGNPGEGWIFRPGMFMPRWASRINLIIDEIRVEQLQNISNEDAKAEGTFETFKGKSFEVRNQRLTLNQHAFAALWDQINSKRINWDSNPWVRVVKFHKEAQ